MDLDLKVEWRLSESRRCHPSSGKVRSGFTEEHLAARQRWWPEFSVDAFYTLALARKVYVDVPVHVDQPFEQLVHSTRDVHVPVPASGGRSITRYLERIEELLRCK